MWFFFPGCEAFALSSLGYLWLFKTIDEREDIEIERVYSDSKTTNIMRNEISLIGISNSFDMDFLEIFKFLEKNNYEFRAKDRKDSDPMIFAGGPVITANPEPYKEIYDFMIIGDGEDVNTQVIEICKDNQGRIQNNKREWPTPKEIFSKSLLDCAAANSIFFTAILL